MKQYILKLNGTEEEINNQIKDLNNNGQKITNVLDYKENYTGEQIKLTVLIQKRDGIKWED